PAGTPGDTAHDTLAIAHQLRRTTQCGPNLVGDLGGRHRRCGGAYETDILFAEIPAHGPTELLSQLCVVAQHQMRVERQMIGEEIDIVLQQGRHALLSKTGHATVLALPEPAVM